MTPVEGRLFQISKPAFQGQSLKVIGTVGYAFVFSQSSCEVSASLTDVGGVAVGATDLMSWLFQSPGSTRL